MGKLDSLSDLKLEALYEPVRFTRTSVAALDHVGRNGSNVPACGVKHHIGG